MLPAPAVLEHELVRAADEFATAAHAAVGQLQKYTGLPYCEHTRAVAHLVALFIDRPECVAAAHLHDVIEDPKVPKAELERRFGSVTAELVDEVSSKATPAMGNRAARAASEAKRIASISSDGKSIKCADVTVNMRSIVGQDPRFASVYVPEKRLLLPSLTGAHPELLTLAHRAIEAAEAALRAPRFRPRP
jgi:(p)ppGpp synthase/HD superfamily hydrolase